ncbi:MAG: DNA polymerase III subunit delta', partial [Proteobacteria bacterium]|nr:DNA polymerase III subunit delta' [Pseudomonadota bacterium]
MTEEERGPRHSTKLMGHGQALSQLVEQWQGGKLAHGWLITGPKGIGKATLAYHFARALLAGEEPEFVGEGHPVFRRVAAGSHTDLLVIEPLFDPKKDEYANDISVDQARGLAQFLSLTAGESQWRVVIVDSVDALNVNGANAILKILEEPPPRSVILLIS